MSWRTEIELLTHDIKVPHIYLENILQRMHFESGGRTIAMMYFIYSLMKRYPSYTLHISWVLLKYAYKLINNNCRCHFKRGC